jgi:4-hydroxybenzoate polyprenyltransferase
MTSASRFLHLLACYLASIACVATYGHIVNDACDVDADRRANKPNAMRNLGVGARILLALGFFVGGFLPALVAGYSNLTLALLAANYLWPTLYSIPGIRLKERGLFGVICDAMGSHVTPTLLYTALLIPAMPSFDQAGVGPRLQGGREEPQRPGRFDALGDVAEWPDAPSATEASSPAWWNRR